MKPIRAHRPDIAMFVDSFLISDYFVVYLARRICGLLREYESVVLKTMEAYYIRWWYWWKSSGLVSVVSI